MNSDVADSRFAVELGERSASRSGQVAYARHIEQSGHHGATYFEHVAFIDALDGKTTDAATPLQGLWSVIVAAAADRSSRENTVVDIPQFIASNGLQKLVTNSD